jgi:hypothetical protein
MTTISRRPGMGEWTYQVGAGDVIATINAAIGVAGWVGGLDSVRKTGQFCTRWLSQFSSNSTAVINVDLPPTRIGMLTSEGLIILEDDDCANAFGGDGLTQWLGITLCALAFYCGKRAAVDLMMEGMVPGYFPEIAKNEPLKDSLKQQIQDNIDRILNEGAARGLPKLFADGALDFGPGDQEFLQTKFKGNDEDNRPPKETDFVAGFLRWYSTKPESVAPYFTRCGLVIKVAACLRAVGYKLEPSISWDGQGAPPIALRAPILVSCGTSTDVPTDENLFPPGIIAPDCHAVYYTISTVGALCMNSFYHLAEVTQEECQTYWINVRDHVHNTFTCAWDVPVDDRKGQILDVAAHFHFSGREDCADPYALGLAAIYFPKLSSMLAHCYKSIGDQKTLDCVRDTSERIGDYDALPVELQRFRVITTCIVLAFTGLLVGSDFEKKRHVATLDLGMDDSLKMLTESLASGLTSGLPLWEAAAIVSALHAGTDTEPIEALRQRKSPASRIAILGRRAGTFCVIPKLLLNMKPSHAALGFACLDTFIGNVPIDADGWILDGTTPLKSFNLTKEEYVSPLTRADTSLDLERNVPPPSTPYLGTPACGRPDVPLYIGIERPRHYASQHMLLTGRVAGSIVAQVSVRDVLRALVRSLVIAEIECPGHDTEPQLNVLNTKTSQWRERQFKMHEKWNIFLHTCGDKAWGLFAAGQIEYLGGIMVFKCPQCVQKRINSTNRGIMAAMVDCRLCN